MVMMIIMMMSTLYYAKEVNRKDIVLQRRSLREKQRTVPTRTFRTMNRNYGITLPLAERLMRAFFPCSVFALNVLWGSFF